jgi:hypothetical protein
MSIWPDPTFDPDESNLDGDGIGGDTDYLD